ncbi:MAG: hypothetical protein L3J22_11705 [Xanthomonadales bacterium]|nr:hypothetical protein [Xanthomonadales bacterium]
MFKQPLLSDLKVAAPIVPGQHLFNNIILLGHILTAIPPLLIGPALVLAVASEEGIASAGR